jgi:hypothetical protein
MLQDVYNLGLCFNLHLQIIMNQCKDWLFAYIDCFRLLKKQQGPIIICHKNKQQMFMLKKIFLAMNHIK